MAVKKFKPKTPLYSKEQAKATDDRFNKLLKFPPGSEKLQEDLKRYRDKATEMGTLDAHIVPADVVTPEFRVWWKCLSPRCYTSGTNLLCPPIAKNPWEDAKQFIGNYRYALVHRVPRKAEHYTGPVYIMVEPNLAYKKYMDQDYEEFMEEKGYPLKSVVDPEEAKKPSPAGIQTLGPARINLTIESMARADGYYFATTFSSGSCLQQANRCFKYGAVCAGHASDTGFCRFPRKVRPEGSASMYFSYWRIAEKMGWTEGVGGFCVHPEDVGDEHYGHTIGVVLIA